MTAPLRNAMTSPRFKLLMAPNAVRELAYVAVFMPRNPHSPLNRPPVKKATGTNGFCTFIKARTTNITKRTAKTIETVRYCLRK